MDGFHTCISNQVNSSIFFPFLISRQTGDIDGKAQDIRAVWARVAIRSGADDFAIARFVRCGERLTAKFWHQRTEEIKANWDTFAK